MSKQRFAVFISGFGSNLQAIIDAVEAKEITAEIGLVFSDKRNAHGLKRAEAAGIKTLFLNPKDYTNVQSFERDLVIYLKEENIEFIALAGYMRMISPFLIKQYKNKILNVHPSLLPSFKGTEGIKDTLTFGCKVAGVTVHFVDEKMDHGAIIAQDSIKIQERDDLETLTEKIHALEHKLYPKAIALFAEKRLKIKGRKVSVLEKPAN